jgi:hypothetical protein
MSNKKSNLWNVALIAIAITSPFLAGCEFDDKLTSECEEEIKRRLLSPSSYERLSLWTKKELIDSSKSYENIAFKYRDIIGFDPDKIYNWADQYEKIKKSNGTAPVMYTLHFEYDSSNAFGTKIRGRSSCNYISNDGKISNYISGMTEIVVDGQTYMQRTLGVFPPFRQ